MDEVKKEHDRRIEKFQNLCRGEAGLDFQDRFTCIKCMEAIIKAKRGAYTDENRRNWLSIVYACMAAPDGYFSKFSKRIDAREEERYELSLDYLQERLVWDQALNNCIYTYVNCARKQVKNAGSYNYDSKTQSKFWDEAEENLKKLLEEYLKVYPKPDGLEHYSNAFSALERKRSLLDNPVFFTLLPYYFFIELAKCEGFFSKGAGKDPERELDPFSIPQFDENHFNWTIRVRMNIRNEDDFKRATILYGMVASALFETAEEQEICSIGQVAAQPLAEDGESCFCVPFWKYRKWAQLFHLLSGVDEDEVAKDIHLLFSYSFRPHSLQSEKEKNAILSKYGRETESGAVTSPEGKEFYSVRKYLVSLCTVYDPNYFVDKEPFQNETLQEAIHVMICLLRMDRPDLIIDKVDENKIEESYRRQWQMILWYGYADVFLENFQLNPSWELVRSLLLYALVDQTDEYDSVIGKAQEFFAAYAFGETSVLSMIRSELCQMVHSSGEIFSDIAHWGGVQLFWEETPVISKHLNHVIDLFRLWEFWHATKKNAYWQLMACLKRRPDRIDDLIQGLTVTEDEPVALDLFPVMHQRTMLNCQNSAKLLPQKKSLLAAITQTYPTNFPSPEKMFGPIENLDDLQYAFLLCCVFSARREYLYHQVHQLCIKFLPLT